jgi:protein SCO1/2
MIKKGKEKTMDTYIRHVALWIALIISFPVLAHANGSGKWVRKEAKGPAPDFTLTDQEGKKVSLRDLRGKVVLMSFIFTNCPAACPLVTAKMAMIHQDLKGKGLHNVSITIDPAHDTPAVLKEYGTQWKGMDFRSWSFLTGTLEDLEPVFFDYKIEVARRGKKGPAGEVVAVELVDHGVKTFIIDRAGMKRFEYQGQDFVTKTVMKDLAKVLADAH